MQRRKVVCDDEVGNARLARKLGPPRLCWSYQGSTGEEAQVSRKCRKRGEKSRKRGEKSRKPGGKSKERAGSAGRGARTRKAVPPSREGLRAGLARVLPRKGLATLPGSDLRARWTARLL